MGTVNDNMKELFSLIFCFLKKYECLEDWDSSLAGKIDT